MTSAAPVRVNNSFSFQLPVHLQRAAPFFGPEGERCWAGPHWNPEFVYPQPGKDLQGAVFTVSDGAHKAVWINTIFDPEAGHMQYVSFVPGIFVSTIEVRLSTVSASVTAVEVTYVRTALSEAAADEVRAMGESDRVSGPHWQKSIESCLTRLGAGERD